MTGGTQIASPSEADADSDGDWLAATTEDTSELTDGLCLRGPVQSHDVLFEDSHSLAAGPSEEGAGSNQEENETSSSDDGQESSASSSDGGSSVISAHII